ncbi:MDR family MFS transporter [Longispora urticae]
MRRWWQNTAGGLPEAYWYLWVGNLINRSGGFVAILLTFYLNRERHFDATLVGLIIGLIGAGGTLGVIIGGQLADRWGRRSTLLVAQLSTAASLLLLGLVHQKIAIIGVGFLLGLSQSMARPAFSAMMIDVVPAEARMRAFSLNYWANNLAFSIAALLGGFVADMNYLTIFVVDAVTTIVAALIILSKVPESRPKPKEKTGEVVASGSPLRDPAFLVICGLTFLMSLVFMQYATSLPLVMAGEGLGAKTYGAVIALNAVMIVAGQPFVPRLLEGRDRTRILAVAALVVGAGFGLTALAHNVWMFALTVAVWTVGEMIQSPAGSTVLAELSPEHSRGRYQGVYSFALAIAAFAAPVTGGFVLDHLGAKVLWVSCLGVGAAVAVLYLVSGPARDRRLALLAEQDQEPANR